MRCLTDHPLLIAEPIPRKLRSFSSRATEVTKNAERAGKKLFETGFPSCG
jgi:hypothetical protein